MGHTVNISLLLGNSLQRQVRDTPQHFRACNDNHFCLDMFKCVLSVSLRDESYLKDRSTWTTCIEPKNVVEFNVGLFSTLLVTSAVQLILCAMQMINGLFGCLCGTCKEKGVRDSWETKWRMRNAKGVVAQSSSNTSVWKFLFFKLVQTWSKQWTLFTDCDFLYFNNKKK